MFNFLKKIFIFTTLIKMTECVYKIKDVAKFWYVFICHKVVLVAQLSLYSCQVRSENLTNLAYF